MPAAEVCRRHGLSPAAFYKFKAKYGSMNVSDIVWPSGLSSYYTNAIVGHSGRSRVRRP
jgi:hypothetical protein